MATDEQPLTSAEQVAEEFNRIRGRLCGLIEAYGLPERQERGAISTLKSLTYDAEKRVKQLVLADES